MGTVRTIKLGDSGPDVALLQHDVNRWLALWGASLNAMVSCDGMLGPATARMVDAVARILGLSVASGDGTAITPRDAAVIRHTGVVAKAGSGEVPAIARRTAMEQARSRAAAPLRRRLAAGLSRLREQAPAGRATAVVTELAAAPTRSGRIPTLIVLHTTEGHGLNGSGGLEELADAMGETTFHVVNDPRGRDARFVADERRAAAAGPFDLVALHLAHLGVPEQSAWCREQLRNTAQWLAYWHRLWGIPLQASTDHGVCQHSDLIPGAGDCDPRFPLAWVLTVAARGDEAAELPPVPALPSAVAPVEYTIDAIDEVAHDQDAWLHERAPAAALAPVPAAPRAAAPPVAPPPAANPTPREPGGLPMSTSDNNSSQQGGVHIPLPPANRIVAFLGPYISLISATVATWLIVHLHVGSVFNVTQDQVASAISQGVVFILTGLLTYFGQHQWLKGHQILLAQGRVDGQGAAAGTAGAAAGANGGSPGDQANQIVADLIR